jgi:hypothetical protein
MRKLSSWITSILMSCGTAPVLPVPAFAQTGPTVMAPGPIVEVNPNHSKGSSDPFHPHPYRWAVADLNCGAPSGCVGEMGIRPFYFLKLEVGAGWNGMAPGVIGSVVLDPIPFGVGISLSMDAGHYWSGQVPFVNNAPSVEYSFIDPMVGLELGNFKAWRFYLRGGFSYLDVSTSNFNAVINNNDKTLTVGDPKANGWIAPAAKVGFSFYF